MVLGPPSGSVFTLLKLLETFCVSKIVCEQVTS